METIEASVLKFKTAERTAFDELAEAEAQLSKQVAVHVRVMCLFSLLGFFFFNVGLVFGVGLWGGTDTARVILSSNFIHADLVCNIRGSQCILQHQKGSQI